MLRNIFIIIMFNYVPIFRPIQIIFAIMCFNTLAEKVNHHLKPLLILK